MAMQYLHTILKMRIQFFFLMQGWSMLKKVITKQPLKSSSLSTSTWQMILKMIVQKYITFSPFSISIQRVEVKVNL